MTVEELASVLLSLLDDFEVVVTENGALKVVLGQGVPKSVGVPPLDQQLADLLADIRNGRAPNPVHQRFEDLRQQIRQAIQQQKLAELADLVARAKNQVN